ncbi:MAG: hypothetical protein C5B51_07145 [Terriglobia bacterium]|nr:MAG: hypothetical protein C5B51_07145 [Terriglobia bacterium]
MVPTAAKYTVAVRTSTFVFVFLSLLAASCSRPATGTQHATLLLRDGTTVGGTVLSTSPTEIQLAGDDKVTRTIPMTQVRSIDYDEAAPGPGESAAAAPGNPPAPASGAPSPAAASAPARAPEPPHRPHHHPTEAAITTKTSELPAGTQIPVRVEETIDSSKAVEGQTFPAEVTRDILDAAGNVVIPRDSNTQIVIRSASKGGKIRGAADLVMDLASVSIDGRQYQLSTTDLSERGKSGIGANKRTAEYTGGAAAVGAIIGAIAGGGKGAAIGAGSGAGAGALTQILTKGTIKVPVESVLTFQLDQPLRVRAAQ